MENNIEKVESILNTERRNKRGNREIRFEVNSIYYEAVSKLLSDYKRVLKENKQLRAEVNSLKKENKELKEYIIIAPNLDEMTATKYIHIRQDAYIQGRIEEQQKAKQIIYENYITVQKVKDKIEELKEKGESDVRSYGFAVETHLALQVLQELLEGREEKTNGKNL